MSSFRRCSRKGVCRGPVAGCSDSRSRPFSYEAGTSFPRPTEARPGGGRMAASGPRHRTQKQVRAEPAAACRGSERADSMGEVPQTSGPLNQVPQVIVGQLLVDHDAATMVTGFRHPKRKGGSVKPREKAIRILAAGLVKHEAPKPGDEAKRVFSKSAVFDVSRTGSKKLPECDLPEVHAQADRRCRCPCPCRRSAARAALLPGRRPERLPGRSLTGRCAREAPLPVLPTR